MLLVIRLVVKLFKVFFKISLKEASLNRVNIRDDEDGHLIYMPGDVLLDKCKSSFYSVCHSIPSVYHKASFVLVYLVESKKYILHVMQYVPRAVFELPHLFQHKTNCTDEYKILFSQF